MRRSLRPIRAEANGTEARGLSDVAGALAGAGQKQLSSEGMERPPAESAPAYMSRTSDPGIQGERDALPPRSEEPFSLDALGIATEELVMLKYGLPIEGRDLVHRLDLHRSPPFPAKILATGRVRVKGSRGLVQVQLCGVQANFEAILEEAERTPGTARVVVMATTPEAWTTQALTVLRVGYTRRCRGGWPRVAICRTSGKSGISLVTVSRSDVLAGFILDARVTKEMACACGPEELQELPAPPLRQEYLAIAARLPMLPFDSLEQQRQETSQVQTVQSSSTISPAAYWSPSLQGLQFPQTAVAARLPVCQEATPFLLPSKLMQCGTRYQHGTPGTLGPSAASWDMMLWGTGFTGSRGSDSAAYSANCRSTLIAI